MLYMRSWVQNCGVPRTSNWGRFQSIFHSPCHEWNDPLLGRSIYTSSSSNPIPWRLPLSTSTNILDCLHWLRHLMIKNPRPVGFPCRYQHLGQPHPSKILATSRILIQSAKRRARIPVPSSFYHGPYSESRPERDYGILTRNPTPSPRRFRPTFLKSKDVDPNFISSIEPVFKGLPVEAIRATLYQGPE